ELAAAGFLPARGEEPSATVPVGSVIRVVPTVGTQAAKGTAVTYYVSTGPAAPTPDATPDAVATPTK
ncbi:MAG: PASTA domain-containing protein, partial [Specibacter sp.]